MRLLNIIGGGRAGSTLGRVWARAGTFALGDVRDRTQELAADAVEFIVQFFRGLAADVRYYQVEGGGT